MGISKRIESILINRVDLNHGIYRYCLGKKRLGCLEKFKNSRNIYYLMAPSFGNVGDEAIVEASLFFLTDMFPEYKVIVIDYLDTLQTLMEIKRILKKEDLIVLQGGGNIGTLYYDAERMREFIIEKFPRTTIISMPQSMYFSNTTNGEKKLRRCKAIYNSHTDLTLIAREKYTYENMKCEFPKCKILLNPDIVFYLSKYINRQKSLRSGVMTCLRTDKEDILGNERIRIINALAVKYNGLIISDTCVPRSIPSEIRNNEVASLLNQFMRAGIVITDRLHGMVMAALTNTPCIVMPSIDNKVIGTYEWIRNIDFIRFVDKNDANDIVEIAGEMMMKQYDEFDWDLFRTKHFINLRNRIGV